jgi:hypothetical protein
LLGALGWHVLLKLVGEARDGQGLEPDAARACESGEEDTVAAEDHVLDAGDALNLEGDAGLEGSDVAGVDAEDFAGGEVLDDDFAGEFEPSHSLPRDLLEKEAVATKDTCTKGLLETYTKLDGRGGAEEAVTVDEVLAAGTDFDGDDVAGDAGGEGDLAGGSVGSVLGHEERAAACDATDDAEDAATTGVLGVGGHLDGGGHPGEFAGLGDDGVVVVEGELEDGHGGAEDAMLHFSPEFVSSNVGKYSVRWKNETCSGMSHDFIYNR